MKKVTVPAPSSGSKQKASLNLYLARNHILLAIQLLEGTAEGDELAGLLQEMMRVKERLS